MISQHKSWRKLQLIIVATFNFSLRLFYYSCINLCLSSWKRKTFCEYRIVFVSTCIHLDPNTFTLDSCHNWSFVYSFPLTNTLCSRNFQNVKLRSTFQESTFTQFCVKPILAKCESQKLPFLQFQRLSTLNFGKFWT